ncbi:hypothetical protein [Iningainema tapete]|uniref:Uncharacterized protein n=1 Tax=Iningainema tapete BLCC-T55 TaxID=2748662 RepID=A0A8J7C5D7_9CYAN|nr:hypothetical protein [Iningainema tapete]MBD2772994.1 hypothetical protein [Iningainema tapete BLCC-T55]
MTTFSRSQFPEFFSGSDGIKIQLKIGDTPSVVRLQEQRNLHIGEQQSGLIELPSVFSHMSFLLIESLSVTQHGEFFTRSKKGSYETIVELGGHTSYRYHLNRKELEEIQQIYEQILENWIGWRLRDKKN